jgi:hypothetical protein
MNPFLRYLLSGLSSLPKSALATIGRVILKELATVIEDATPNPVVKSAEVAAFASVDAYLAAIEAAGSLNP